MEFFVVEILGKVVDQVGGLEVVNHLVRQWAVGLEEVVVEWPVAPVEQEELEVAEVEQVDAQVAQAV